MWTGHTVCLPRNPPLLNSAADQRACDVVVQDEERLKKAVNQVPSNEELNTMVARSESELQLFNRMDAELDWPDQQGPVQARRSCRRFCSIHARSCGKLPPPTRRAAAPAAGP